MLRKMYVRMDEEETMNKKNKLHVPAHVHI